MDAFRAAAMPAEAAPAKVNLTLRVLGRRPDGYHELESLVAFVGVGDVLAMDPSRPLGLEVAGPEAVSLETGNNLVLAAAAATQAWQTGLRIGHFRLEKRLPVAAGLGGGSADAAAALRLIARASGGDASGAAWLALAASIGSDVPVCLGGRAALMCGRGEVVVPLAALPESWLVLANPRLAVPTGRVFKALGAGPLEGVPHGLPQAPTFTDLAGLVAYMRGRPNALESAAISLCPVVAVVREALAALPGALIARMSGSGATCFALFAEEDAALAGAEAVAKAQPAWWVRAAPLL